MTILPSKPLKKSQHQQHSKPDRYGIGGNNNGGSGAGLSSNVMDPTASSAVAPQVASGPSSVGGKKSRKQHSSVAVAPTTGGASSPSSNGPSSSTVLGSSSPASSSSSVQQQQQPGSSSSSSIAVVEGKPPIGPNKKLAVPSSSKQQKVVTNVAASVVEEEEERNSDDEYGNGFKDDELEIRFAERLKSARGFLIKEVKGDGACMFRAVADQIYGDEEMHTDVRALCMDYIAKNRDHFSQFLTEDFDEYLHRKRAVDAHGNHVELQAISEIFSRPIEIFEYSIGPINTFHPISPEANSSGRCHNNAPIRLSYHGTVHYNSVVDPYTATIGVGLGLPGFQPGAADRQLVNKAVVESESQHIEEAMLKDKLRMTDWERTEEELSKQIAKESYMEYIRQMEEGGKRVGRQGGGAGSGLGAKRGASSPNIPCCSRDEESKRGGGSRSPVAKMHRDGEWGRRGGSIIQVIVPEGYSSSMPNISPTPSTADPTMRPSTSASSLAPATALSTTTTGLYEELLASSAVAGVGEEDDVWGGGGGSSTAALDEAAMLAQAMALSQQEFYESMMNRKKGE